MLVPRTRRMEMPVYMQKGVGLDVKHNVFRTWGTMMGLHGAPGYIAGFLFHEILSAAIALLYAAFFSLIGVTDNLWLWGAMGAVVHYLIAGVVGPRHPCSGRTGAVPPCP